MSLYVDDPWALDDFQRRVFHRLFSDQGTEAEKEGRRQRRQALVRILEGVYEEDNVSIQRGAVHLLQLIPQATTASEDHDFDVVTS